MQGPRRREVKVALCSSTIWNPGATVSPVDSARTPQSIGLSSYSSYCLSIRASFIRLIGTARTPRGFSLCWIIYSCYPTILSELSIRKNCPTIRQGRLSSIGGAYFASGSMKPYKFYGRWAIEFYRGPLQ